MRGLRSGLHAQCNIEPPSTSYVLHSTAQVKMTGVMDGDDILAPRLGGSTAQWPPSSFSSSLHRLSYPCPADWTPDRTH